MRLQSSLSTVNEGQKYGDFEGSLSQNDNSLIYSGHFGGELNREFLGMFGNQMFLCIILSSNLPLNTSLSHKKKKKAIQAESLETRVALSARRRAHTQVIWPTCSELSQAEREQSSPRGWRKWLIGQAELGQCPVSGAATPHLAAAAQAEEASATRDTGGPPLAQNLDFGVAQRSASMRFRVFSDVFLPQQKNRWRYGPRLLFNGYQKVSLGCCRRS